MKIYNLALIFILFSLSLFADTINTSFTFDGFNLGFNTGILINQSKGDTNPSGSLGPSPGRRDSYNFDNAGFIVGGQLGCKYKIHYFLFGAETDFNYSYLNMQNYSSRQVPADPGSIFNRTTQHLNWFGTFRPIFGFCYNNKLLYLTGGFSCGSLKSETTITYNASQYYGSLTKTKAGWNIGGGFEWKIIKRWSVKAEYLFIQFANLKYKVLDTSGSEYFYTKLQNQMNCLRCGFNLKF